MIKMQTALLILTVFIACLYFSAKRKSEISKLPICDTSGVFTDVNFWKIRLL